jgi:hypothetical protein
VGVRKTLNQLDWEQTQLILFDLMRLLPHLGCCGAIRGKGLKTSVLGRGLADPLVWWSGCS